MLRWKRVEISAGALLLGAALYYLDEQGVLLMAFCACALHELGHWLVIRALGGRVTALRITCVGAEMRLSARCPLGYWQQIAAALAGPAVNLLAARMAAGLGTEGAYCFAGLNLALAAFNLLPAVQLDGGRILWCILALLTSEERAERLLRVLSSALAVGLVLGALLLLWQGGETSLCSLPRFGCWCRLQPNHAEGHGWDENSACNPLRLVVNYCSLNKGWSSAAAAKGRRHPWLQEHL